MSFLDLLEKLRLSPAKRDRLVLILFALALIFNIALWALIIFNFWKVSDFVVLHYDIYFGIGSLGPWQELLFAPLVGFLFIIGNGIASLLLHLNYRHLSYFLATMALVANLILLISGSLLVYSNF